MSVIAAVVRRDLTLAARRWSEFALPPLFLLVVASLFPLAVSPASTVLSMIGPGVVWVAALLAALLGQELLFRPDYDDGALELMALSPTPLAAIGAARVLVHWCVTGLPLIVVTPLVAVWFSMSPAATYATLVGLLFGTPVLSLIGGIAAALTVSLRRSAPLLALLVLPLCVPVVIFGARAASLADGGVSADGPLYLLAALLVLSLTLAPFAVGAALRISLE